MTVCVHCRRFQDPYCLPLHGTLLVRSTEAKMFCDIWDSDSGVAEDWRSLVCDAVLLGLLAHRHSVTCQKTRFLSCKVCSCTRMSLCVARIYCVGILATPWTFYKSLSDGSKWESVHLLLQPLFLFFVGLLLSSLIRWTVPVYFTVQQFVSVKVV